MVSQQSDRPSDEPQTQALIDQILLSLAAKSKDKDDDSNMIITMAQRQLAEPSEDARNEESFTKSDEVPNETGATLEKAITEEAVEYPPPAQAALAMLALLLALFLSALVSLQLLVVDTSQRCNQ